MFQISPGVQVREEDLSLIIPSVPVSIGAFVGEFDWGPINRITTVDSTETLEKKFGRPTNQNAGGYFTAWNFLQYSQDLRLIRAIPNIDSGSDGDLTGTDTIGNAVAGLSDYDHSNLTEYSLSGANTVIIKDEDHFDYLLATDFVDLTNDATDDTERALFYARYPGGRGNRLQVSAADSTTFDAWTHKDQFAENELNADEMAVLVLLDDDVVETFVGSANPESTDENGRANFIDFLINRNSDYIYIVPANTYNFDGTTLSLTTRLTDEIQAGTDELISFTLGGSDYFTEGADSAALQAMIQSGWDEFAAAEDMDINYCMTGDYDNTISEYVVQSVCEMRKDCVAFISPTYEDAVMSSTKDTDIVEWRNTTLNINSSYAVMDGNYKLQLDPFNRIYRWVPLNGDIAGLAARTANIRDPWWSPAGLARGQIKNVVRFAFIPSKAQRDELYKNGINIVTSFPGEGNVLWGDKTLLSRPSAFDRLGVRMLFIVIEKAIAKAARNLLFEFNDEFTRNRFTQSVEPYLRDIQGRRGIIRHEGRDGFIVVADERVNTPEVIDSNEFRARIIIKPARSINFAELTFSASRTGVEFDELLTDLFPES